jgi:hypothetical protein
MSAELLLVPHVTFGVLGILTGVWVFVELLNVSKSNKGRIKYASIAVAVFIWLSYVLGGYWYVTFYGADKAIIKAGPWPWAHSFSMEVKEHLFFTLLLLSTYLPIAVHNSDFTANKATRNLVLVVAALIVFLGLAMEGFGALTSMGVRMGLLGR